MEEIQSKKLREIIKMRHSRHTFLIPPCYDLSKAWTNHIGY